MSIAFTRPTSSPEGMFPPLPEPLPEFPETTDAPPLGPVTLPQPIRIRSVRCGCWLLNYKPIGTSPVSFDGTLRVECHSAGRTASGDLYQRPIILLPNPPGPPRPVLLPGPNPADGIPILSRSRYRYYLRVTQILERFTLGISFQLDFEMWRFTAPNSWTNEGAFTAQMVWIGAPSGYPSASDYLEGDVKKPGGAVVGRLKMGW